MVWELQLERRGRPERVSVSWEHRAQAVTSLCWDTTALRVFVGDAGGKVSFLRAGSSKLGKVLLQAASDVVFLVVLGNVGEKSIWLIKGVRDSG